MKNSILVSLGITMFLVGCNMLSLSSGKENIDQLEMSEVSHDDFKLKLVSNKSVYNEGEEIEIYAGIKYIGDKEQVEIQPMSSLFLFDVKEHTKNVKIEGINLITGDLINLKKNMWYEEEFEKSGDTTGGQFINEFFNSKGFPAGEYTIIVRPAFSIESNLINDFSTQITIKVVDDTNQHH